MTDEHLFDTIKTTVQQIDTDLQQTNRTGIYFAPEIYIAFCIGQAIMKNQYKIFGTENVEWLREINLGNGGLSDIAFKAFDKHAVIELKLRGTYGSYKTDIEKLQRLPENYDKYFCVLLDSFSANNDERLTNLQKEFVGTLKSIGQFAFLTWNNWYVKETYCILNLYSITNKEKMV